MNGDALSTFELAVGPNAQFARGIGGVGISLPQIITATLAPATSALTVGQSLDETTNWATFLNTANYASSEGTIVSAVADFTGASVADATTAFDDLDTNRFAIIVTDSEGNVRTFGTSPLTVVHIAPTFTGTLDPISYQQGLGPQTYEDAQGAFTGLGITWSINPVDGLSIQVSGFINVDTNETPVQTGTAVTITATNSGGSVSSSTTLEIIETILSFSGLTGGAADLDDFASIGALLSNGREIDVYRWGSTLGGAEYGGNVNPTAFTAGTLYLEATAGLTYSATVTAVDLLKFDTQPSFGAGSYVVGDTVVLSEGTASPSATITVEYFRLDGVDKSGELSGLNWDSTGETAGTVTARFRAASAGQSDVLSDAISVVLNPLVVIEPPVIRSMTVGAMDGNDIPITFDFTEDQPTPYTVSIVMVVANDTAPTSAQVQAGDNASDTPAIVAASYEVSADGVINVDVGAIADGTYDLYATVEDADGHLWGDVALGEDVVVTNPSTFEVVQIGILQGNNATEAASSFTFDLSGYVIGDEILIAYGVDAYTTSVTVTDANVTNAATTKLTADQSAAGSNKLSLHKYVLTTDGEASTTITVNHLSDNNNMVAIFGVKGGTIGTGTAVSNLYRGSGSTALSGTLTPTGGDNYSLVLSMSTDSAIVQGSMTFTGVSQLGTVQIATPTPTNRPMVLGALSRTGDSSALAFTFNGPAAGPLAVVGVAITAD